MKELTITIILGFLVWTQHDACAATTRYSESLCKTDEYYCITIKSGDTWEDLFPNNEELDIVKRANRMNIELKAGMTIAIPRNLERLTIYDISPFPRYVEPTGEKTIFVSQKHLAWGAYDSDGELVWWGPLSSGSGRCSSEGKCVTPSGMYHIIRKQDIDCISTAFPVRADGNSGGAIMPYCMHFFRGFALHGSDIVPGYNASHGCVRMFIEDARWLNEEFIDVPGYGLARGTKVIVGDESD